MGSSTIPVLLVTANVGSIFEDPSQMLKIWTQEFLSTVSRLDPKFIALHCQEVGGKNYENSMKHVEHFVKLLMSSNELRLFDKVRVYLDEDYSSAEHFTALGNLYFIHESVDDVLIWDFKELTFVPVIGKEIHSGNIEAVVTKEKAKFPQDFFPECKWSRKGFLRTRWSVNGTIFDLVNIHLFHDASNFIAMEAYPSVYCKTRRRALEHTLQRFHNDAFGRAPYFLFGDFNFRTDTDAVIKKLTEGLNTVRIQNNKNNEYTKLQYTNDASELVLTVGKKEFNHSDHQTVFLKQDPIWLKPYDKELEAFEKYLTEYPVTFPPSYPFEENISRAESYMQTRCPAWCDRVLLSLTAKELVSENEKVEYGLIGLETCMGDHKPVYLRVDIKENSGTLRCCDHAPFECLPNACSCCQLLASVTISITDHSDYVLSPKKSFTVLPIDSKLLHEPITRDMLLHDPYTPESTDSRSPLPEKTENGETKRNSVSPELLKNRLEKILKSESEKQSPVTMRRSASQTVDTSSTPHNIFRARANSEMLPRGKRLRLISTDSVRSLSRLQSHHSSSDENWFESENESCNASQEGMHDTNRNLEQKVIMSENSEDSCKKIHEESLTENIGLPTYRQKKLSCCCII